LWQPIARLPGSSLIVHFNFQGTAHPCTFFRHRFFTPVSGDEKAALSGDEKTIEAIFQLRPAQLSHCSEPCNRCFEPHRS
jgi:hypothetical protein